ncbi:MAG: GNAT family N-acetyltransferase [Chloroflexota bacterium]
MITLIPIEQNDFDVFLEQEIFEYAQDKIKSGNWLSEQAMEKSRAEFQNLLPDGLATKDQYLFTIFDDETGNKLGVMWFQAKLDEPRRRAFINDFVIEEKFRGKGFGKQAMQAMHEKLRDLNVESVSLHVFAHNTTAIALYEKMGYEMTNLYMNKTISDTTDQNPQTQM